MLDSRTRRLGQGRRAARSSSTSTSRCRASAAPGGRDRRDQVGHVRAAVAGEVGHGDVGRTQRHPAVRGQAVVGDAAVPSRASAPEIRSEPTGRPPRIGGGVDRLAGPDPGEAPAGAGAEIARTLGDAPRPRRRRASRAASRPECTVTASRSPPNACPTVTVAGQQPGVAQRGHRPGEGQRQRALVAHHVDHPGARPVVRRWPAGSGPAPSADRRPPPAARRGRVGVGQQLVVRRALLVGPGDHGLQRQIAGLDQVAGRLRRLGGDPAVGVEHGDDQRVAAGAQAAVQRGHIEQHPVADRRARPSGRCRPAPGPRRRCRVAPRRSARPPRATGPLGDHLAVGPDDHARPYRERLPDRRARIGPLGRSGGTGEFSQSRPPTARAAAGPGRTGLDQLGERPTGEPERVGDQGQHLARRRRRGGQVGQGDRAVALGQPRPSAFTASGTWA